MLCTAVWRSVNRVRTPQGRDFIKLSELFIEVENELLSGTFPGVVQNSGGHIGV